MEVRRTVLKAGDAKKLKLEQFLLEFKRKETVQAPTKRKMTQQEIDRHKAVWFALVGYKPDGDWRGTGTVGSAAGG
jgi:hypothetical protein